MYTSLTIAGSDSSGGAGIQADIKTMTLNHVFAMSVITALTSQNTMGVTGILNVPKEFVEKQLDAVFSDIVPDSIKIGMVSNSEIIEAIATKLKQYKAKNIVVDPVMIATSGSNLLEEDSIKTLREKLFPLAKLITPNIFEAEVLSKIKINDKKTMLIAGEKISKEYNCAVLVKGGHSINDADDLLYCGGKHYWFYGKRIENKNTHGTGCTLSSAIAANLAKGFNLVTSIKRAKKYIEGALSYNLDLGQGAGPMNHAFDVKEKWKKESKKCY